MMAKGLLFPKTYDYSSLLFLIIRIQLVDETVEVVDLQTDRRGDINSTLNVPVHFINILKDLELASGSFWWWLDG